VQKVGSRGRLRATITSVWKKWGDWIVVGVALLVIAGGVIGLIASSG
jgi:hypothetical protein